MGIDNDLILECDETVRGSLNRIFVIPTCDITSFTAETTAHSFNAVTLDSTSKKWYEYEFERDTKSFNGEGSNENGTATFTNTLEGMVKGLDKNKLQELQNLVDDRKLTVIAETLNKTGTYKRAFVIGWDDIRDEDAYAEVNINSVIEGELDGDNSATMVLTAQHAELIREYVGSIETNSSGTVNFGT